jgi:hypothetical protein
VRRFSSDIDIKLSPVKVVFDTMLGDKVKAQLVANTKK